MTVVYGNYIHLLGDRRKSQSMLEFGKPNSVLKFINGIVTSFVLVWFPAPTANLKACEWKFDHLTLSSALFYRSSKLYYNCISIQPKSI